MIIILKKFLKLITAIQLKIYFKMTICNLLSFIKNPDLMLKFFKLQFGQILNI